MNAYVKIEFSAQFRKSSYFPSAVFTEHWCILPSIQEFLLINISIPRVSLEQCRICDVVSSNFAWIKNA